MPTLEENIEALRVFARDQNLQIFSEQKIEHGQQLTIVDQSARVPINFFTTGTISVQGKNSELKSKLQEWANLRRSSASSGHSVASTGQMDNNNRSSRYIVPPAQFQTIRTEVIDQFQAVVSYRSTTQEAEVYRAEIQRGAERVTATQFQTGTLFVQGRSSSLFEDLCDALDQRLSQSFADRAVRFLPEDTAQSTRTVLESTTVEKDAWLWARTQLSSEVFEFLWTHDRQTVASGAGILMAVRETRRELEEFSPVVMPFGKTFEGFIAKLSVHLDLVTEEKIKESVENITIGAWIAVLAEQTPDLRRYGFAVDAIKAAWGSRNKCMHADPKQPMPIRSLEEAAQEIDSILRGMKKAYDVYIAQEVKLKTKQKKQPSSAEASPPTESKTSQSPTSALAGDAAYKERFDSVDVEQLATQLLRDGYELTRPGPDGRTIWELKRPNLEVYCAVKSPGRVTVKGEGGLSFTAQYRQILESSTVSIGMAAEEELFPEPTPEAPETREGWIGVDESGKGDVFGPLVIAGVFVEDGQVEHLLRLGVRDSKTLSDAAILRLSTEIKRICPHHAILAVEPVEYNLLYERLQNLNRLLALKHAEVISRLAASTSATHAISDQFADERLIPEALAALDCRIALEQRPRAEDDIGVASASILARAEFVLWLDRSSQTLGYTLPPGAAQVTIDAGRRIVSQQGRKALARFAKLHFRTVREMLS